MFNAHERVKRKTLQGKKAKKDLVHVLPLDPSLKGKNVQVNFFDADMQEEHIVSYDTYIHRHFTEITNDLLDQDKTGQKLFKVLENARKVDYDPYLDAPSDGEQDSSLEDEEMKGRSP